MLMKPLDDAVGSTKEGRFLGAISSSQSERPATRSGTPATAEPCAALCLLQVYKNLALFWVSLPSRLADDGERSDGRPRGRSDHSRAPLVSP
jgi:hypothetical protein